MVVAKKTIKGNWQCWYPNVEARNKKKVGKSYKTETLALVAYNKFCVKKKDALNIQWKAWGSTINSIKDYDKRKKFYELVKPLKVAEAKKYHGVGFHAKKGKFEMKVKQDGKEIRKTFATAREAAEAADSFSIHVKQQKFPLNFPGKVPKKMEFKKKPNMAKGGRNAIKAQVEYREKKMKKTIGKRKNKSKRKAAKKRKRKNNDNAKNKRIKVKKEKEEVKVEVKKEDNKLVRGVECCVCCEIMVSPVSLRCGHGGCEKCLKEWLASKPLKTCPICRKRHVGHPTPNLTLRNLISDSIIPLASQEEQFDYVRRLKDYDSWKSL